MTALRKAALSGAKSNRSRELLLEGIVDRILRLLQLAEERVAAKKAEYNSLNGWFNARRRSVARGTPASIPSETAVSEALVTEIQLYQNEVLSGLAECPIGLEGMTELRFVANVARSRKRGIGRFAKPTDIAVYFTSAPSLDIRIEAKGLLTAGEIRSQYLSPKGMQRFSDPAEPYGESEVGGMIAYTVTKSRNEWRDLIGSELSRQDPPIPSFLHQVGTGNGDTLFCKVPYTPSANQKRTEILIFHHVLQFDSDPAVKRPDAGSDEPMS